MRRAWIVVVVVLVIGAGLGLGYVFVYVPAANRSSANHPPVANISASSLSPATYQIVVFNGSASHDPDGDALTFDWAFSDGPTRSGVVVNRTFLTVGTFTVTLTVIDSHGAAANATKNITTHPATLKVGTSTPYPPFEFYNANGVLVGFDIDLADTIASRLVYAAVWSDVVDFNILLSDVQYGGVDMGAAAIQSSGSVGASRNSTIAFSNPYYHVSLPVLVRSSDNLTCPLNGCTAGGLANRTVAVVSGSAADVWVQDNLVATNLTPSADVQTYASELSALQALRVGSAELGILDTTGGLGNLTNLSLRLAGTIPTDVLYSLAFPKTTDGLALRDRVNAVLQTMAQDGTYASLYLRWFGT